MHEFLHNPMDFFLIPQVGLQRNPWDYKEIRVHLVLLQKQMQKRERDRDRGWQYTPAQSIIN